MNEPIFDGHRQIFVRQRREMTEILIDWETRNQYDVMDEGKNPLGTIAERAGGAADVAKRFFLRSHRGFQIRVLDPEGEPLLELSRSFFFLFSDLQVTGPGGEELGSVHRRFGLLYKRYDLRDAAGQTFARVKSPLWRLWTFPVESARGTGDAVITKRWGGALREVFADADTFLVDYASGHWSANERAVVFAAAISIDFDFFENNQGSGGLLDWFD
ncbi:MAG: hypothetical protein CL910_09760 [Deltaproteobacteria bacterium]|jgi:uncharacterized protein YxjI|nr:hypothetical protein [Deltaproteobacteria bacterium]